MSSWGERMASVVSSCGPRQTHPGIPYHRRLEKVKFGVPLDQVCKRDIPGPLLVMLLKLNKEGPFKKDVFRAPGHQGNMRKLIHFLQQGRLVNIQSFSVNTIASVLKKFLRKVPGGIFGPENEADLFTIINMETEDEKLALVQRIFMSLPIYSQHLLVLLFGTFRVIHSNCRRAKTGMTAEALGVSVAPSFFHTCVSEGKVARPEEVQKFKLATKIVTFFIEHFGMRDLFGRENYEYYARLTGRILKVEDEWIFFTAPWIFPSLTEDNAMVVQESSEVEVTEERTPSRISDPGIVSVDVHVGGKSLSEQKTASLEAIPENCPLDPNGRLSTSLDDQNVSSPSSCGSQSCYHHRPGDFRSKPSCRPTVGLGGLIDSSKSDETDASRKIIPGRGQEKKGHTCLPQWNLARRHSTACTAAWEGFSATSNPNAPSSTSYAISSTFRKGCSDAAQKCKRHPESKKSSYPSENVVHQRQTERMRHRSEWFLSDPTGLVTVKCRPDRPSSLDPSARSDTKNYAYDMPSPCAMDVSGSVSLPLTSIGALPQHDTSISTSNPTSSMTSHLIQTSKSPLPPTLLTATSATPTRSRSPSNRLPISSLINSPSIGTSSMSTPITQPDVCDTVPSTSTQSSIPPFMTFSSSRKLHQHFANQATSYSAHASTMPIPSPVLPSSQVNFQAANIPSGKVSTDHHSFLQSMIKNQAPVQMSAGQTSAAQTHQLFPHVTSSTDIPVSMPQVGTTTAVASNTRGNGSNNARLRRRLSDKDKERRLVRRSSSKRKDKENGGDTSVHITTATSSGSLEKFGSSGALTTGVESSESGPPSIGSITAGIGGIVSVVDGTTPVQSRPRGAQLKRAGSADTGGANVVTGNTSPRNAAHTLLCRTGSQDNPHVEGLINPGSSTGGTSTSAASPLTKSLPRI